MKIYCCEKIYKIKKKEREKEKEKEKKIQSRKKNSKPLFTDSVLIERKILQADILHFVL